MIKNFIKYKMPVWSLSLLLLAMTCMVSCSEKYDEYYHFQNKERKYSGSSLQYLESEKEFDSMMVVINRISWIKDSLNSETCTIFALPNQCFSTVLQNLNSLRKSEHKAPLYLKTVDSAQLDILISRYVIPGLYTTDSITFIDGRLLNSLKYGYQMQVQPQQLNASGLLGGGPQKLLFSDPKNSRYTRDWVRTTTKAVNIITDDGVVDVLSSNHNFGFQEFVERMNK